MNCCWNWLDGHARAIEGCQAFLVMGQGNECKLCIVSNKMIFKEEQISNNLTDNNMKARLRGRALQTGKPARGTSHMVKPRWPPNPYHEAFWSQPILVKQVIIVIDVFGSCNLCSYYRVQHLLINNVYDIRLSTCFISGSCSQLFFQ